MYQEILNFWFEEIDESQWWIKDAEFDEIIRQRFLELHHKAVHCELYPWRKTSLGALAEIIILDQFSRNMFRDKPESFAYDSLALALSQVAIASGFDSELSPAKRKFFYMPFMHSESLVIHSVAGALFAKLGNDSTLTFENRHRAIIEQFGRYPHRNKILGRVTTPEEEEFLRLPGSSF
ncbi:MAG: hypothetical protein ACI8ZB_004674 [Desulforhopalus sp.]|jgi:uncharacterized protein (DUF924 family)